VEQFFPCQECNDVHRKRYVGRVYTELLMLSSLLLLFCYPYILFLMFSIACF